MRMSASLEGNVGSREFVAYPARVANVEKRRRRSVRDCGMKLTMDGKLSRKEVRERERREGEKAKKVAKREMRKGVNWKEFSANGGQRGREREKRQLLIESEFEETQKKGEKKKWEKEGKLPWKSEGGSANSIRKGRGERWVIIEKIDPTSGWLVECLTDSWEGERL